MEPTTRENLYVSMTRGCESNVAYVALDQPDDSHSTPESDDVTAWAVLYGVLQHSGADLSATQTIETEVEIHGGIDRLAAELETTASEAQRDRFVNLIRRSGLTAAQHASVLQSNTFGPPAVALRRAEAYLVIGAGGLGHIGIQVLKAITAAEILVVDRNDEAVKLALSIGADHGIVAEGKQVEEVLDLTGGHGAEAVIDFVGEGGATSEGLRMLRRAGDYHVVGYGEDIAVPTIDVISSETNIVGNLVGSYNDLADLMALAARGAPDRNSSGEPRSSCRRTLPRRRA